MRASGRILVTVLVLLTSIYGRAQQPYAITIERNTSLKMRDGVVLHADIYRPGGPEKFPILLERTPYNKDSLIGFAARAAAERIADRIARPPTAGKRAQSHHQLHGLRRYASHREN